MTTTPRATVRIPTPLRSYTEGADEVQASGATVKELLADLDRQHGGLVSRLLDERGELRPFVNLFVGEKSVKGLEGLDTPVPAGAVLSIVPAVAGGSQ